MLQPTDTPAASKAPRFAASMMPGPASSDHGVARGARAPRRPRPRPRSGDDLSRASLTRIPTRPCRFAPACRSRRRTPRGSAAHATGRCVRTPGHGTARVVRRPRPEGARSQGRLRSLVPGGWCSRHSRSFDRSVASRPSRIRPRSRRGWADREPRHRSGHAAWWRLEPGARLSIVRAAGRLVALPGIDERVDVASLALRELELAEQPANPPWVVVRDRSLEVLAQRRGHSQLSPQPAP